MSDIERYVNQALEFSKTPYPAWILSSGLYLNAIGKSRNAEIVPVPADGLKLSRNHILKAKPTRTSALVFGTANLLGGYMIYDGDLSNGAGFSFVWSSLYLLVNGGASIKSLFRGHFTPLGLSTLALGNSFLYAKEFFWHREEKPTLLK